MMTLYNRFDGFTVTLTLDEEDDWVTHFEELPNVSAFGPTPEEALNQLEVAWEAMKESYQNHGEPVPVAPAKKDYSGHFNIRVDKRVHRALAVEAAQVGLSLNALVAQKLAHSVKEPYQIHPKT
jgi:predicted HicB family RNase H-like nuclease